MNWDVRFRMSHKRVLQRVGGRGEPGKALAASKPAFAIKPLARNDRFSNPLSKSPREMCGEELGDASVAAAREQIDSLKFWTLMVDRAKELVDELEPRDVSLLLNGLGRTRRLVDFPNLLISLEPIIQTKLAYFSSIQLAMLASAFSKAGMVPPNLLESLVTEVKNRVSEFSTPVEFSMVLNALSKLGVADKLLFSRFSQVVQSRMEIAQFFHVRELAVIASAFASAGLRDLGLFEKIRMQACPAEATPVELAKLVGAFAKMDIPADNLLTQIRTSNRFRFLSSGELVNAVFAFGQAFDHAPTGAGSEEILNSLKLAFLASFPLFQPKELAAILLSFSRWRVQFSPAQLEGLLEKLARIHPTRFDRVELVSVVGCLGMLGMHAKMHAFLLNWEIPLIHAIATGAPGDLSARAVTTLAKNALISPQLLKAVSQMVIRLHSLDSSSKAMLREALTQTAQDSDLMLVLRDR